MLRNANRIIQIFFGLSLGQKLYGLTDNLSKILQKMKLSAISGQRLASQSIKMSEKMRSDRDFDLFYELISKKALAISGNGKPEFPRKRNKPINALLQFLCSTMTQRRSNALAILNSNESLVDKLPLVTDASDFVDSRPSRRNDFRVLTEKDL